MMTDRKATVLFASILSTARAVGPDPAPLGPMYAAMMGRINLSEFHALTGALRAAGLCTLTPETLTLTDKGRELAAKVDALTGSGRSAS